MSNDILESFGQNGGAIILVIGLSSLVALTVFILRTLALRRGRVAPRALVIRVRDLVLREEVPEAMTACRTDNSSLARIFLVALRQAGQPRSSIKEHVLEVGRHEAQLLQGGLVVLDVVAVIAPLLGLLGTVWGMIDVFRAIEVQGVGNAGALAGGIGTALYTTFAGLLVAIPVRVSHSIILSRAEGRVMEMEEEAMELIDLLVASTAPEESEAASEGVER